MFSRVLRILALAACTGAGLLANPARAEVLFCNGFKLTIFVAIAYPQSEGGWISRGWLELAPKDCRPFDTALKLSDFYFRAESEEYRQPNGRSGVYTWGKDRNFATWSDDNFNYWGAQDQVLKSTLALYSQAPTMTGDGTFRITFSEGAVAYSIDK